MGERSAKPNNLTVLFVHQSSEMYGSDKVLLALAIALEMLPGFRSLVVLPEKGPLYEALVAKGVETHAARLARVTRASLRIRGAMKLLMNLFRGVIDINRIVAGRPIAVVHSNTLAVVSGSVWARCHGVPHLWHVHEIIRAPMIARKGLPLLVRWLSNSVVSNSTMTQAWLLSEQPNIKPRAEVVWNGLGPPPAPIDSDIAAFRRRVRVHPDQLLFALVGRINRWKGHWVFIEAAEILYDRGVESARFAIVGGHAVGYEGLAAALEARITRSRIRDRFSILPYVEDVWTTWYASDVAVVPSIEPEPFGLVAIEAMAVGKPVIAARHGGLVDIVQDGTTGILVEPGSARSLADAMEVLAIDASKRREFGLSGQRRQMAQFNLVTQVAHFAEIYRRLAGPRRA
jgi:glycosyltransferase involved in cell wall biosynthesis